MLLGITQNQLEVWEQQYSGNAQNCWRKVMEHWLNGGAKDKYPPTWDGLYDLLEDARCSQVAEELKRTVNENEVIGSEEPTEGNHDEITNPRQ